MFLQSGKSQLTNLPSTPLISVPGPLDEFTPFSGLPLELRRKIWGFAVLFHPRFFELVWFSSENNLHQLFKVSKQTNRVPPIMEVNREAREEGMRIFEKRVFNNCNIDFGSPFEVEGEKSQCTWFNPDLDTIYFGENTCIRTVAEFFNLFSQMKVPKIAFAINVHVPDSCKCNWNSGEWNPGNNSVTSLQILHGRPLKGANSPTCPGSPSTREVYIVLPSFIYRYAAGEMPNTITFRPSVHDVLEIDGVQIGAAWANEIHKIKSGLDFGCGPSRWTNGSCPDFNFVSFGPCYKDGKGKKLRHDGLLMSSEDCEKITAHGGAFLEDLKLRTGVDIRFGSCSDSDAYPGWWETVNEVGLFNGTNKGIKECEVEILAHCLNAR
ncbi:uncharacterized protein Bfra_002237 [Botrytis fragariae]|uniref:2EXR domain-containing protein n=1 Tax=Botrytis fragariae TaxID=1964551 RepID=A0A8H6AYB9_9HELO|nr:uncharacterized protein Bfra_002237 [Botrytis fragariae]KAF5875841.1 hypothetical protein Bfra_002237 [Botrytis fragariae]